MVPASGDETIGGAAQAKTPINSIPAEGWPDLVADKEEIAMRKPRLARKRRIPEPQRSELPRINLDAAGLDIHQAEIWACVPCDRAEEPIRCFGRGNIVLFFILQSSVAIVLLHIINYLQHYGLLRRQLPGGKF